MSSSHRQSRYTVSCPECGAEVSLSARRLLVRVDEGTTTSGEVLFTCLSCDLTVTTQLDAAAIAVLVTGGVTHLSLSAPEVEPLERVPAQRTPLPPLTHDDLIDLHGALAGDTWIDQLVAEG
jgi:transcription elongation factor Elf1